MLQQNVTQRESIIKNNPNTYNYPPVQWLHHLVLLVQDGGMEVNYHVLSKVLFKVLIFKIPGVISEMLFFYTFVVTSGYLTYYQLKAI